ncbi:MAG: GRRM system radical SAM/SPASM domain protein [Ktedonobacteraceae bacterium]|nr:GRRM system radical SAM/SPASM domain protein [Ktedonobacteraceae bacterium]
MKNHGKIAPGEIPPRSEERVHIHMQVDMVIIQSVPFCNLNCSYCYLPQRAVTRRISSDTLSQIFRQVFSSRFVSDEVTILWHAGEPLILPVSFYEDAIELQKKWNKRNVRVVNSLQTNATLITQDWCDFFKTHAIKVGVSLDGPEHIHDAHRVDRTGRGSFHKAMQGVMLLQENGLEYSIIAVVTKEALHEFESIWHFFERLQPMRLGFNPEEREGINTHSSLQTEEEIEQYKTFLQSIIALSVRSHSPIIIREVESVLKHLIRGSFVTHSQTNTAMSILSFDYNGNVSTFSPELLNMTHPMYEDFTFGNVHEMTVEDILSTEKFIRINKQIQRGVALCRQTCSYFMFCGGGSPSNKLFEHGTFDATETMACRLHVQAAVDVVIDHLEEVYDM